jgi:peptide/nickel transport system ATP-binding protein
VTDTTSTLLSIKGLVVTHDDHSGPRTILSGIDLDIREGETVGIVGESGSGKSITAKAVIGLLPPRVNAKGSIRFRDRELIGAGEQFMAALRGPSVSLLMQDPFTMLDPLMVCGEQIVEGLRLAMPSASRDELRAEAVRRLAEVGIRDPEIAARYPFQLSGGMRQRVALAAALGANPDLLIADEPSTALDVTTQAEILELLRSLQRSRGMALLLITHDLRVAFSVCDRVNVFYAGRVLEAAPAGALATEPLHPYGLGLMLSEPVIHRRVETLSAIPGSVPTPDAVADRCAFAPRCHWRTDICEAVRPPLREIEPDRRTACVRIEDIRTQMSERHQAAERSVATPALASSGSDRDVLLRVEGASKQFEGRRGGAPVVALSDVSIEIGAGESVGLVGESGSGKTTLGRCIVGLETLSSGRISIAGLDASDYGRADTETRRKLRRTAQIVFQDPYSSLNPRHTIGSALGEALAVNGFERSGIASRTSQLLDLVGLPNAYTSRYPRALSGGERQRVAIARALAVDPRLLVCDEPVSALDVSVQAQILTLLRDLRKELGLSYLFITHDLAVVRQIVDRVYVLYRANVVETGPVDQVLDVPNHDYTRRLVSSIPGRDIQHSGRDQ